MFSDVPDILKVERCFRLAHEYFHRLLEFSEKLYDQPKHVAWSQVERYSCFADLDDFSCRCVRSLRMLDFKTSISDIVAVSLQISQRGGSCGTAEILNFDRIAQLIEVSARFRDELTQERLEWALKQFH